MIKWILGGVMLSMGLVIYFQALKIENLQLDVATLEADRTFIVEANATQVAARLQAEEDLARVVREREVDRAAAEDAVARADAEAERIRAERDRLNREHEEILNANRDCDAFRNVAVCSTIDHQLWPPADPER